MAGLTMTVIQERRAAVVTIDTNREKTMGITAGTHRCHVLGLFQYSNGDGEAYPVFVVELEDGRVIDAPTEWVQFVDTVREGGPDND